MVYIDVSKLERKMAGLKQNTECKLLYIFDHLDWKSRMPVALGAKNDGYDITIGIVGAEENIEGLNKFQVKTVPKPQKKFGPISVLSTILSLRTLIRNNNPNLLHTVTLKYSFLVGLACLGISPLPRIYTIAGLGFLFRSEGTKPKIIRAVLSPILKLVLKNKNATIIFQNPDDRDLLIQLNYVRKEQTRLVISSGVDLEKFIPGAIPNEGLPIVLMPTRLVHEKGVAIFVKAAKNLRAKGIKARYQIAGGLTAHNPRAISKTEMEDMVSDGTVEWLGRVEDMPALLQSASIIVYPSYYGEGVPRVTIEALAAGRPVITTDHPGCKEVIPKNENGILIPVKDVKATEDAMEKLLSDKDLREKMGKKSRELAERSFDVNQIVHQTLNIYASALNE